MTPPTPAELLDLLVERADRLRAAGVLRLELEGLKVELAPAAPTIDPNKRRDAEPEPAEDDVDPFRDPATFGLRAGVPGFTRPKDDDA